MVRGPRQPARAQRRRRGVIRALGIGVLLLASAGAYYALDDSPVEYSAADEHLKYGSTGAERTSGIPKRIWLALPEMFPEYLPGPGYASLGFIYEPKRVLPVGVSERSLHGIARVALGCGACHAGAVRSADGVQVRVIAGMPANTLDVGALARFLFRCATDARFTPEVILAQLDRMGSSPGPIERARLRHVEIYRLRERLLALRQQLDYAEVQPEAGPGRIDEVTGARRLLGLELGEPYRRPVGTVDFASLWLLEQRDGLDLHWDGSSRSAGDRVWYGALHTGVYPGGADGESLMRMLEVLKSEQPPEFPVRDTAGPEAARGKRIYQQLCARCHGASGRSFEGEAVGKVVALDAIGTDPNRAQVFSEDLAQALAGIEVLPSRRLVSFRKPDPEGYAAPPLDGLWLRAPYLHNGSVPTLRDLLEPSQRRPKVFYRGSDRLDGERVGFVSDQEREGERRLFPYYTGLVGNSNAGHEGDEYGTELSAADKDALVQYLKTF